MIKKLIVLNSLILLVPSVFFTSVEAREKPFKSNEPLKEVSIDLIDFNSPTLTSATTLYTSEVCELPATLSSGRESADPIGGFRVNSTTRYLEIDFTGYNVVGYRGTFYLSSSSVSIRFNGTNSGTFTRIASSGLEVKTVETMVTLTKTHTDLVRINASGSFGIVEITIYYQ